MNTSSQQEYAATQYAPRAQDYVTSLNHSTGEDLEQIAAALRGKPYKRVLDLGCGGGHVSYVASPHVREVVAADVTPSMLEVVAAEAAKRGLTNITTQQAAAEALPFEDASFCVVLSRFTGHHWQNLEAGLREAKRVLRPGGLAMFIDTVCPADRVLDTHLQTLELLRDASHVRNYNVAEWTGALERAGFALRGLTMRKLRMDFPVWIARTRTSPEYAAVIRSVQAAAPDAVKRHFAIGEDGGFDLDCVTFEAA